jgi:hypothetical protein
MSQAWPPELTWWAKPPAGLCHAPSSRRAESLSLCNQDDAVSMRMKPYLPSYVVSQVRTNYGCPSVAWGLERDVIVLTLDVSVTADHLPDSTSGYDPSSGQLLRWIIGDNFQRMSYLSPVLLAAHKIACLFWLCREPSSNSCDTPAHCWSTLHRARSGVSGWGGGGAVRLPITRG